MSLNWKQMMIDGRAAARAEIDAIEAELDAMTDRTPRAKLDSVKERMDAAFGEWDRCDENLKAIEKKEAASNGGGRGSPPIYVNELDRTYRPDKPERSFFRDAIAAVHVGGDFEAAERLQRNAREQADEFRDRGLQMRDVTSGAFTGLVIPQYLADNFVDIARAGGPLLNRLESRLPIPDVGMTVNIGRMTTGTAVAAQATEGTAVQETDSDDTLLTINVRTYAGMQDVSRQAYERGSLVDEVIFRDLTRAYFTAVDSAILNGAGTSGTHLGIRSTSGIITVTYTDGTPTVAEFYPKLQDAIQQINAGLFLPATAIVMHPRRWGWLQAAVDSTGRPLSEPQSAIAVNPVAVGGAAGYGPVGSISGIPVITDGNIPTNLGTNEDCIIVTSTPELWIWEETGGIPRRLRFEQVAPPENIRLAVWS